MAFNQPQPQQHQHLQHIQHQPESNLTRQVAKTATAVAIGGSFTVLSGLTMVATVIGLVLATPMLVISSPVWVPALITSVFLIAGFVSSGGFAATSVAVFYWMYKYVTGKHPMGADRIDHVRGKIADTAGGIKDRAAQFGHEYTTGGGGGVGQRT